MTTRWGRQPTPDPEAYDERWRCLAAQGRSIHGEADFVMGRRPARVLDAGCGTGRVAIELRRRGVDAVGVDLDAAMLERARQNAPEVEWHCADLATLDLRHDDDQRRRFDLIVLAGNVMIFLAPGTEGQVLHRLASHLRPGGELVAGFQLQPGRLSLADYDAGAAAAGLTLVERFATWEGDPFTPGADYAVSVSRSAS